MFVKSCVSIGVLSRTLAVLIASTSAGLGQPRVVEDEPAIFLSLEPSVPTMVLGSQAQVIISLESKQAFDDSRLTIVVGGQVEVGRPPDVEEFSDSVGGLPEGAVADQFRIDSGVIVPETRSLAVVSILANEPGYGYLRALFTVPGPWVMGNEFATLHFLIREGDAFFSRSGRLDLDVQALRADMREAGRGEPEIERAVDRLRGQGASVDMEDASESDPPEPPPEAAVVSGRITFMDESDKPHPVRFAHVEAKAATSGLTLAEALTSGTGEYALVVPVVGDDPLDVFVRAWTDGAAVEVKHCDQSGGGNYCDLTSGDMYIYHMDSSDLAVSDGDTVSVSLTASSTILDGQAFEVYEATNTVARYLPELGEPLPEKVTVLFARDGESSVRLGGVLMIAAGDPHDWDNIQHEYGHHLQSIYTISDTPGGPHRFYQNLCATRPSKDEGMRLAWAEAWPTYFALQAQHELDLDSLLMGSIPRAGDTNYDDVDSSTHYYYSIESNTDFGMSEPQLGEGNELAVQRALWDLYDDNDESGIDSGVKLTPEMLWDQIIDSAPTYFYQFYAGLISGKTMAEIAPFGSILAEQDIATESFGHFSWQAVPGIPPNDYRWRPNLSCNTADNAQFQLQFYRDDYTVKVWPPGNPWMPPSNADPHDIEKRSLSWIERWQIFTWPAGQRHWLVASTDQSAPATGPYFGEARPAAYALIWIIYPVAVAMLLAYAAYRYRRNE